MYYQDVERLENIHGDHTGLVYFIGNIKERIVKIGITTTSLKQRLREISTGNPYPLTVLGCIPCYGEHPREAEKKLHKAFSKYGKNGEWFDLSDSLAYLIWEVNDNPETIYSNVDLETNSGTILLDCLKFAGGDIDTKVMGAYTGYDFNLESLKTGEFPFLVDGD